MASSVRPHAGRLAIYHDASLTQWGITVLGRLAVCSWSLQPTSPRDLARKLGLTGLNRVQLALDPIRAGEWSFVDTRDSLANVSIVSGMMATVGEDYSTLESITTTGGVTPDAHWPANRAAAEHNAAIARDLGLRLVTLHAGALPHNLDSPESLVRAQIMVDRVNTLADIFEAKGVALALETGQETAPDLLAFLDAIGPCRVGVNFDPANMILYGSGDPTEALSLLAPRIVQTHCKDADPAPSPGVWGTERPAGQGSVDWDAYFSILPPDIDIVIERESGNARVEDVIAAAILAERYGATR